MPTFPVVPNPYTLLSAIPPTAIHFTVLDLKDAFFTIPLHPLSQTLFAFTWQDLKTHVSLQLTWTVLPQGFRDSPHFFGQSLQKDLQTLDLAPSHLQYVDDLLLCSPTRKLCLQHTAKPLGTLGSWGYQIYRSKVQIAQTNVTYLGLSISHQQRTIPPGRIQALINCPLPKTKRELLCILGLLTFSVAGSLTSPSLQSHSMRQLKDVQMSPSLTPLRWPILFASSPRASSKCQLSTCQITLDHSFYLHTPTKDRPWDFCVSGPEVPGLPLPICQNSLTW